MAKAISVNKWLVAGAAGAIALLCIHRKRGKVAGIGRTDIPTSYKRNFATRYFEDHFYTLSKVMPVEDFIELWVSGKAKALANNVVKLNGKKYKAPATNSMINRLDNDLAVDYYKIEFTTPTIVNQGMVYSEHPDLFYRGLKVTQKPKIDWGFE